MKNLLLLTALLTACADPIEGSVDESVLIPPKPQPQFQFCDGVPTPTCMPGDPSGDFICTLDCLEPAFCPDYTATDFTRCQQHPLSSGCCPVGGDPANAVPCFSKKCIKGDRP